MRVVRNELSSQLEQKNRQVSLMKEAIDSISGAKDKLEDELAQVKTENKELKRKHATSSEQQLLTGSKFRTQVASLETENAQLKKHIGTLYAQLDEQNLCLARVSNLK